jgi:hypothetical protein
MPHKDPKEACRVIFENLEEIPAWPQLPNRSFLESMYVQCAEGMPGVKVEEKQKKIHFDAAGNLTSELERFYELYIGGDVASFGISDTYAAGLHLFFEELAEKCSEIRWVKGQLIGPITFGLTVADEKKQAIIYNEQLMDAVTKTLARKVRWQEQRFRERCPDARTIIFLDEPYLRAYGSAYVSVSREDVVRLLGECFCELEGLKGVHVCGNTDWGMLTQTGTDIISFDAYDYTENLALYPDEIRDFLDRDGVLAWGVVPAVFPEPERIAKESLESLTERFEWGLGLLVKKGFKKEELLERSLITPTCGTGAMSEELAERSYKLAGELSKLLRKKYFE